MRFTVAPTLKALDAAAEVMAKDPKEFHTLYELAQQTDEYLHWDEVRRHTVPGNCGVLAWWGFLKMTRPALEISSLCQPKKTPFTFSCVARIQRLLHEMDRLLGFAVQSRQHVRDINDHLPRIYFQRSIIEEAITSSQLEGATTTREEAQRMIAEKLTPRDVSELMILRNYETMQRLKSWAKEEMSIARLLEMQKSLTEGTLENPSQSGRFRNAEEKIGIYDNRTGDCTYLPPAADLLPERMEQLVAFANEMDSGKGAFVHPIVRAIILHFMLGYEHPFCDGNGRTARALFYWSLIRSGYWMAEYISISRVLKFSPASYAQAYQRVEHDAGDTTYFVLHQLEVLLKTVHDFHAYIALKSEEHQRLQALYATLNERQIALLEHAYRHDGEIYTAEKHQTWHSISLNTARSDLQGLVRQRLFKKSKNGKTFVYSLRQGRNARMR